MMIRTASAALLLLTSLSLSACELGDELPDDEAALDDGDGDDALDPTIASRDAFYPGAAGYLHLWDDARYADTHVRRQNADADLSNNSFNDKASSLVNKTGRWWKLYENRNYGGAVMCLRAHSHVRNLRDEKCHPGLIGIHADCNDMISAVRPIASKTCVGIHIGEPN